MLGNEEHAMSEPNTHIERYTQGLDAEISGQLHPIFANILKAAGMQ